MGQGRAGEELTRLALEFLSAVDEGRSAGTLARQLALEVLRRADCNSALWSRAVAVLEGGPLRIRHAVELAGEIVDACSAVGIDEAAGDRG